MTSFKFQSTAIYKIKVYGAIKESLSERLQGMEINIQRSDKAKPVSILTGRINDQSALSGILNTLYDNHYTLISINTIDEKKYKIWIEKLIKRKTLNKKIKTKLEILLVTPSPVDFKNMKVKIKILDSFCLVGSLTSWFACSDDDENPDSDLDPNVFCDENLCADDADLKAECVDAFYDCLENEPDLNDDECAATALLICRL